MILSASQKEVWNYPNALKVSEEPNMLLTTPPPLWQKKRQGRRNYYSFLTKREMKFGMEMISPNTNENIAKLEMNWEPQFSMPYLTTKLTAYNLGSMGETDFNRSSTKK